MKIHPAIKIMSLLLLICMISSCHFATPGNQWIGLSGYAQRGFMGFSINLFVVSVTVKLGTPLGLGVYSYGERNGYRRFLISHPIPIVPGIHVQLFPFLSPMVRSREAGAGLHILIVGIGMGI